VSWLRARARGADTWYANGTESRDPNTASEGNPNSGTWQPVWDAWQRFIEPLVSQARGPRIQVSRRGSACVVRVASGSQGSELDSAGCCGRPQQQERGPAGPPRCPRSVPRPRPGRPPTCCSAAQWPMNGGTGNHEEEQQADGSAFRSLRARWPARPALAEHAAGRAAGADQGSAQCAAGSARCQGVTRGRSCASCRQSAERRAQSALCMLQDDDRLG